VLEFLRRHLQIRPLDALGNTELRQGTAHADDGHGARSLASTLPERADRDGFRQHMKPPVKSRRAGSRDSAAATQLLHERELRHLIDTVLRLAKSIGAEETEVHVDEIADALTRFDNNGIHQNVAEQVQTVTIRYVVYNHRARVMTN